MKVALSILILLIILCIYFKSNNEGFTNNESDNILTNKDKDKNIYMVRIIGNCLPYINDPNQNLSNLKYILENEPEFPNVKKVWVLNRIIDKNMEDRYVKLLKQNNKNYETIPFNKKYFSTMPVKLTNNNVEDVKKNMKQILYASNINGARNYVIDRFKNECEFTMVLDANIFMNNDSYDKINTVIQDNDETDYILVPIKRISKYSDIEDENLIDSLENAEPQIIFSKNSTLNFNEKIPYGFSNKVELLNLIGSKGSWNGWKDNERLNVVSRKSNGKNYKHTTCSYFIRLPSKFDGNKHKNINQKERTDAILKLININK
jgi:hypothetical protein